MTLRTLNYGNYGIFLIMGHAGFCPSTVVWEGSQVHQLWKLLRCSSLLGLPGFLIWKVKPSKTRQESPITQGR